MSGSEDWRRGRRDGLQEAIDILLALEDAVALKLERRAPSITQKARLVRRQAFKTGARRLTTRLRQLSPTQDRIEADLRRLSL